MAFSPFDSAIFRDLYGDPDIRALFTDSAEVRAMLLVEGTLAKVQGELGVIPLDSALLIHRASLEIQVDPSGLGAGMASAGVPVPALVAEFRKAMEAPEHAQYVHWGATSQDIIDTALVLRLRQFIGIIEGRLTELTSAITQKAKENRDVVMAARTRGQMATPTTFGAKIAGWIAPLKRHQQRLTELRGRLLVVSLAGASGNYAAMAQGDKVELALAEALKLLAPDTPWHSARDNMAELASVLAGITTSLGKIGQDIILLSQTEIAEITAGEGGGSST
ncbi:MAG: lyase family protein, partial [Alphaproteobacteria bacterium]